MFNLHIYLFISAQRLRTGKTPHNWLRVHNIPVPVKNKIYIKFIKVILDTQILKFIDELS